MHSTPSLTLVSKPTVALTPSLGIRPSQVRWTQCMDLLRQVAAVVQGNSALDAGSVNTQVRKRGLRQAIHLERQIDALQRTLNAEADRVTIELLRQDVAQRQKKRKH